VQLDRGEAFGERLLALARDQRRLGIAQQARVAGEPLALRATQQRMQGLAGGLAGEVPQRNVEAL
jgi:hypothetical protein